MGKKQFTICGLNSVRAVATYTPEIIERLFFDASSAALFSEACRHLAQMRKTYRLVTADELKRISDSTHHQGAAALIDEPPPRPLAGLKLQSPSLCLHDVLNPHNIGAILRTAAFFGVSSIVVSRATFAAAQTQSAWRIAEGGLTHVTLYVYENARDFFSWIRDSNLRALGAIKPDGKKSRTLREFLRDKNKGHAIICLGNEEEGLPAAFVNECNGRFSISGSGKVESLNVSVAAALCLNEIQAAVRGPQTKSAAT